MDLIYANADKKDIGIIEPYSFDLAFGKDENNFECVVDINDHCLRAGYIIYCENSEIGGIVDSIKVNTEKEQITYTGRSWHGILENKIISPDVGKDYLILDGESNAVISSLIKRAGLSNFFEASTASSGIYIEKYQVPRFEPCYTAIIEMLRQHKAKLKMLWKNGKVQISVLSAVDYTNISEFNSYHNNLTVIKNYRPCNHLICLGKGDLADRKVIHLFTNEDGTVQPYSKVENPITNDDYILDESKRVIFGEKEVVQKYDLSNAETTTNYVLLNSKPSDWDSNFKSYYTKVDEEYKAISTDSAPSFASNKYYKAVYDDYAVLVQKGIEKLTEYWSADKCTLSLSDEESDFDINDIVGAQEVITGTAVKSTISKKIIKIKNNETSIEYEVK